MCRKVSFILCELYFKIPLDKSKGGLDCELELQVETENGDMSWLGPEEKVWIQRKANFRRFSRDTEL